MHNEKLAKRIAKETGVTRAQAAHQLDTVVTGIVERLRQGKSAPLGKLGAFLPGPVTGFTFRKR